MSSSKPMIVCVLQYTLGGGSWTNIAGRAVVRKVELCGFVPGAGKTLKLRAVSTNGFGEEAAGGGTVYTLTAGESKNVFWIIFR